MADSLPPPTAEEQTPYKDLTGQVCKTEDHYFSVGGFSEIYEGEWTDPLTGEVVRVAIKLLRGVHTNPVTLEQTTRRLRRETWIWRSLSHKNVLPFLGLCSGIGPSPAMISPLCVNGDIHRYLVSNPQVDRLAVTIGVACGLEYLHSKDVVHGNLKGHNVIVDDDGTPRLSDYNRSKFIDHRGFTSTFSGFSRYMAPELFAMESDAEDDFSSPEIPGLTKQTYVYSFSMLALEILTGKLPFFYLRQDVTVVARVGDGTRPDRVRCMPTIFTDPMWELMVNCWDQDPAQRPDMGNVVKRLECM